MVLSLSTDHAQMGTQNIVSTDDEISSQLSLILVKHFGSRYDKGADSCLSSTVQSLEFKIGWLEKIDKLSIGSSTGTTAVNVGCNVMNFLAVLLYDDGSTSGSGISSKNDTSVVLDTTNGGTGLFIWHGFDDIFLLKELISDVMGKRYLWLN